MKLTLLAIGIVILQFFFGLVATHIGYEKGLNSQTPTRIMELCVTHKPFYVNGEAYWVYCSLYSDD